MCDPNKDVIMTLSPQSFRNTLIAVMALAYTAISFGAVATPVLARDSGVYYRVELAQSATETRAIAAGVAWSCQGSTCVAKKASSRPVNACKKLVRELGAVASFSANGKPLSAEKLAKCNGE
ncbi:MAG: hypothetical protein ABJM58_09110 [Alteripontixanthobacter sp.]